MTTSIDHHDRLVEPVSLTEAARILGVSREAVRSRIRRGLVAAEKRDGAWVVMLTWLTTVMTTGNDQGGHQVDHLPATLND